MLSLTSSTSLFWLWSIVYLQTCIYITHKDSIPKVRRFEPLEQKIWEVRVKFKRILILTRKPIYFGDNLTLISIIKQCSCLHRYFWMLSMLLYNVQSEFSVLRTYIRAWPKHWIMWIQEETAKIHDKKLPHIWRHWEYSLSFHLLSSCRTPRLSLHVPQNNNLPLLINQAESSDGCCAELLHIWILISDTLEL